ncbi:MAG: NADH-quinone oxidoreductase subunit M [Gemmatimonadetes bacterium]|nr:NADH-quinone oxidoreductase subunit M [Gemmatimonadota bacterium]
MLTASLLLPLFGALIIVFLPKDREPWIRGVAVAAAAAVLVILMAAWLRFEGTGGFELVETFTWIPTLGVGYIVGVDGISLPLAAMTAVVFLVSVAYPVDLKGRAKEYFALFLFLETASLGVFLALDLFLFYVFWDLTLVGMYFLIGAWGHGEEATRSALKFFLYTLAASLVMLLAILALYLSTDPLTFDMAEIIRQRPLDGSGWLATLVFVGFSFGFIVKAPLVPFHTWLPPAHVDAPAPVSAVLAGVLLKMGTYGFIRILLAMMPETFQRFAFPLAVLALVSIVYGALVALAQPHIKRRIAYTSVNHMGYAVLGIAAAGGLLSGAEEARTLALTGATVEMVAHGLITGALFLLSGSIWSRAGTFEIDRFGGLASRTPGLTLAVSVAAFASLGLPGLAGFVAEFQIFVGTFGVFPWLAATGLLGILITAALFLQMLQQIFLGQRPPEWDEWRGLRPVEAASVGLLLALVVLIGVLPAWLLAVIDTASRAFVGP